MANFHVMTYRCSSCGALNRVPSERADDGSQPVCGQCKTAIDKSGKPQNVSDAELATVVKSADVPVLVDFWAPWCGPCRATNPIVEQVAKTHAGKAIVLKVNVDEHQATAMQHQLMYVPSFLVFKDGELKQKAFLEPNKPFDETIEGLVTAHL